MADAVETFQKISRLILKWILIAAGVLIALVTLLFAGLYGYNWYTYDRHVQNIQFLVSTDRNKCPDDKYPIHIIIGNTSVRTLERVTFALSAREPGRSSDLTEYNSFEDDHVSPPNQGYGACWSVPKLREPADPRTLPWSIKYKTVYFKS